MSLKSFFKENNIKVEKVQYLASDRFKDEKGNYIYWILKVLTNQELDVIRDNCTKNTFEKHQPIQKLDSEKFAKEWIVKVIEFPNLYDKELQDSYGVMDPYDLLCEILTSGEMLALKEKINSLHDYDAKQVDDIKN